METAWPGWFGWVRILTAAVELLLVVFSADFCFGMFIIFIFRNECETTKRNESNNSSNSTAAAKKGVVGGGGEAWHAKLAHKYAKQLKDSWRSNLGVKCE